MYTCKVSDMRPVALTISMMLFVEPLSMPMAMAADAGATGPTADSALATDERLAKAIDGNDAQGIESILDDSWAVIATTGGMAEGKNVFPDGIKSGALTRKTYDFSDPRVRLYGNVAVVTSKIKTSGVLDGKPFDVMERQTDVLVWKDGAWKCVLTHETKMNVPSA